MKNILIIGSRDCGKKNNPYTIANSLKANGLNAEIIYFEDLLFSIEKNNISVTANGNDILANNPEIVIATGWYKNGNKSIYRDIAYSLALFLKYKNISFWNSEMIKQRSTTKLSCMVQLAVEGISVPKTVFSLNIDCAIKKMTMPFVAKAAGASRGENNFLVNSEADLEQIYNIENYFIFQPFLENDHDLRVICFGGVPSLVLRRSRRPGVDTHLNNTSKGGDARWLELSDVNSELLTISQKICKVTGREMAGIDFIPDASASVGYSCLEVNAIPQLTSGTDSEKKLFALVSELKNNKEKI
jgi:glutathione synthase/RimK-type ligase-like ATP-grasp enzyme